MFKQRKKAQPMTEYNLTSSLRMNQFFMDTIMSGQFEQSQPFQPQGEQFVLINRFSNKNLSRQGEGGADVGTGLGSDFEENGGKTPKIAGQALAPWEDDYIAQKVDQNIKQLNAQPNSHYHKTHATFFQPGTSPNLAFYPPKMPSSPHL